MFCELPVGVHGSGVDQVREVLRHLRKEGVEFAKIWNSDKKYEDAFLKVRARLSERTVLSHIDYEAAAKPAASRRPFELCIGAPDYGWSPTLTQRPGPYGAPRQAHG